MAEYDMPIEEHVRLLVKEFKSFKSSMETRLDSIDSRFDAVDARFDAVDARFDTVDGKLESLDGKVVAVTGKVDKMQILLEQTHAIARLGLEGLQGLRESTDEKFAAAAKANAEQTDLLKSLVVHVRKRVERIEQQPKRRRRT